MYHGPITRWWFQICFMFIPIWGNDPILTNIFQMGWNHQLDKFRLSGSNLLKAAMICYVFPICLLGMKIIIKPSIFPWGCFWRSAVARVAKCLPLYSIYLPTKLGSFWVVHVGINHPYIEWVFGLPIFFGSYSNSKVREFSWKLLLFERMKKSYKSLWMWIWSSIILGNENKTRWWLMNKTGVAERHSVPIFKATVAGV